MHKTAERGHMCEYFTLDQGCRPQQPPSLCLILLVPSPLALAHTAPNAEALIVVDGPLEAQLPYLALGAHHLRLMHRTTLLREEGLGVGLGAQSTLMP